VQTWIEALIRSWGYTGVAVLIFLENVFPPIPSEVILLLGGFYTARTPHLNIFFVIICATAGSCLGAAVLYFLGRALGFKRIERLVSKLKFLHIKPESIHKADDWYKKRENKAVFFCRLVPVLRSLISIPAGISGMNFGSFMLLTAAGSLLWNTALCFAGHILGDSWEKLLYWLDLYAYVVYACLAAAVIVIVVIMVVRKKRSKTHVA